MGLVEKYSSKFANINGGQADVFEENYNNAKEVLATTIESINTLQTEIDDLRSQKTIEETKKLSCSDFLCIPIDNKISQLNSFINTLTKVLSDLNEDKASAEQRVSETYEVWESYKSSPVAEQQKLTEKAEKEAKKIKEDMIKAEKILKNQLAESEKSFEQKLQEQKSMNKKILIGLGGLVVLVIGVSFFKR